MNNDSECERNTHSKMKQSTHETTIRFGSSNCVHKMSRAPFRSKPKMTYRKCWKQPATIMNISHRFHQQSYRNTLDTLQTAYVFTSFIIWRCKLAGGRIEFNKRCKSSLPFSDTNHRSKRYEGWGCGCFLPLLFIFMSIRYWTLIPFGSAHGAAWWQIRYRHSTILNNFWHRQFSWAPIYPVH